ncbi:serine/threonine-protein phosphatase 7 long form homolog [Gossypium raimondii]|uniref:serine/threonine-protein phosphatase 7 long form homolog n=1 Tax=Gossypium raimondii TaxID=29730 RepID=UPI00227AF963|nr:serine/threonine-protein phosphatase 7 long form homolog [Gossypium raimondii]
MAIIVETWVSVVSRRASMQLKRCSTDEGPYSALRGRVNSVGFQPDERLIPYLELAGFGSAALIRTFDLRYDLIYALVERWRPETHTFHLPCRECTVTIEDVAVQLGLPIDENAVTGVVRAYIMHLIGGVLMPNANGSKVHLMYLPLLSNLHNTRSYSWGSAVLAMLYRELCRTTAPSAVDMGGCLILLQSWALYRMPFLAPISHQSYVFPLVNRWSSNPGIEKSQTVPIYRLMIENHAGEGFIWMSYSAPEIMAVIPSSAHVHSNLWCISAPIINFNVVEWYHGNRVLRQFGCIQYIPTLPVQLGEIHGMSKKGRYGDNWEEVHEEYITIWNNRFGRVPQMDRAPDLQPSLEYIQWYCETGKPFLFGGRSIVVPPYTTRITQPLRDLHHAPSERASRADLHLNYILGIVLIIQN